MHFRFISDPKMTGGVDSCQSVTDCQSSPTFTYDNCKRLHHTGNLDVGCALPCKLTANTKCSGVHYVMLCGFLVGFFACNDEVLIF